VVSLVGQTLSHFHIVAKLGEGGMGVVYKAQDLHLNRIVALKFLPRRISANESEKARFLQEAQAAAVLNHPNICTIHAIEELEGEMFIVMECVDGVTLKQKEQDGVKYDTALQYAVQIGEALQEAHSKGIVHRDVKAENVMVNSKNQIKVMDFGLAKLKGLLKLTKTLTTLQRVFEMPHCPPPARGRHRKIPPHTEFAHSSLTKTRIFLF